MEKGEVLTRVKRFPFDVVRGVRDALQCRTDRKYGTPEERRLAYGYLYEMCEVLFTHHADKVGTLPHPGGDRYQRLILAGMPDAEELIVDKNIDGYGEFRLTAMNCTMGPRENPVVYDRRVVTVSQYTGSYHTEHSETHYPPNFDPRFQIPDYIDRETKQQPLAARSALHWAGHLAGNVTPIENHILMVGAVYE